jgi:hypothetical protein
VKAIRTAAGQLLALYRREPAATQAAAGIVWAAAVMVYRAAVEHTAPFSWQVAAAAGVAVYGLAVRAQVIPVVKWPQPVAQVKPDPTAAPRAQPPR